MPYGKRHLPPVQLPLAFPTEAGSPLGQIDSGNLQRLVGSIFGLADEGIAICDARGRIQTVNPAFCEITGYEAGEVQGQPIRHLRSPRHEAGFYVRILRHAIQKGSWRGEAWGQRRRGQSYPSWLTLSVIRDGNGVLSHFLVIVSDMARLSARHLHLEHMAHHDPLTGLPNRMLLLSRLDGALARSRRKSLIGAVLFVDLDLFKSVNERFGHEGGDEVLREVGRRLSRRLRQSDLAARFGGDEFVLLLEELQQMQDAGEVAHDLIRLLRQPIQLPGGASCEIAASVGIAVFQGDAISPEELVRRADEAMFDAKHVGRGTHSYYTREAEGLKVASTTG